MDSKQIHCTACGAEIPAKAKKCASCGAKIKKPIFKKWWFWAIIAVLLIVIVFSGNDVGSSNTPGGNTDISANGTSTTEGKAPENAKTEYYVGDTVMDGDTKIVFMSSGEYHEENDFLQPTDGKKYIFLQFAFENTSQKSDTSISSFSFECYADGFATEKYYMGDDTLSATLSAGRSTSGYIYFEVPEDAELIEVEYETNIFTEKKIKFIYEGEKNSGYTLQVNASASEDAYSVGDVVESSKLIIRYLSCEEYISDNMFEVPADGYRYITCEFEFENIGNSDEFISAINFDCYADGSSCKSALVREDMLSATLSAGRKTKGTVTFEVPIDANVVEVEYLSNYWTSNRVVFTVK